MLDAEQSGEERRGNVVNSDTLSPQILLATLDKMEVTMGRFIEKMLSQESTIGDRAYALETVSTISDLTDEYIEGCEEMNKRMTLNDHACQLNILLTPYNEKIVDLAEAINKACLSLNSIVFEAERRINTVSGAAASKIEDVIRFSHACGISVGGVNYPNKRSLFPTVEDMKKGFSARMMGNLGRTSSEDTVPFEDMEATDEPDPQAAALEAERVRKIAFFFSLDKIFNDNEEDGNKENSSADSMSSDSELDI